MDGHPDDMLMTAEVGAIIDRAKYMVNEYIRWHGLPATRRAGRLFVRRSDLEAWRQRPEVVKMLERGDRARGVGVRTAADAPEWMKAAGRGN